MANLKEEAVAAGSKSNVGKNLHVFRQTAYEGRTKSRLDADKIKVCWKSYRSIKKGKRIQQRFKYALSQQAMIWNTASNGLDVSNITNKKYMAQEIFTCRYR